MALDLKLVAWIAGLLGLDVRNLKKAGGGLLKQQTRAAAERRIAAHAPEIVASLEHDNHGLDPTATTVVHGETYTQLAASVREAVYWTLRKLGFPGELADVYRDHYDEGGKILAAVQGKSPTSYAEVVQYTTAATLDQLF